MDSRMAHDLDNYITGHYGEDQFKGVNYNCDWKIGDRWVSNSDTYILARTRGLRKSTRSKRPYKEDSPICVQFINIRTGNAWTDQVIDVYKLPNWDGETVPIGEICKLVFGRDISISTSDEDNIRLGDFENSHEYGPAWED